MNVPSGRKKSYFLQKIAKKVLTKYQSCDKIVLFFLISTKALTKRIRNRFPQRDVGVGVSHRKFSVFVTSEPGERTPFKVGRISP